MKYKITTRGIGGEFVGEVLTKEQFDFWSSGEENLEEYFFTWEDDLEENYSHLAKEVNFKDGREWHDVDGFMHVSGPDRDCLVIVEDENGKTVYEGDLPEDHELDAIQDYEDLMEDQFYVFAESIEKGSYEYSEFELPDGEEFDINKLVVCVDVVPYSGDIISGFCYDEQEIYCEGGDTTGKSMGASIYEN